MSIQMICAITFFAVSIGFLFGSIVTLSATNFLKKYYEVLMGFTGGLLISIVCFSILPVAFEKSNVETCIIGVLSGILVAVYAEFKIDNSSGGRQTFKVAMLIVFAIALHKIPEGIALGSLLKVDKTVGIKMVAIIAVHCVPEAAAMTIALKGANTSVWKIFALCFLIGVPVAFGSFVGAFFSNISTVFVSLCLSFAGGVMIYITCGEIIPDFKSWRKGALIAIGSSVGFGAGVVITGLAKL